jgi:hypothetical protein
MKRNGSKQAPAVLIASADEPAARPVGTAQQQVRA